MVPTDTTGCCSKVNEFVNVELKVPGFIAVEILFRGLGCVRNIITTTVNHLCLPRQRAKVIHFAVSYFVSFLSNFE